MEKARGVQIACFIRESQMERDSFIFYKSFYEAIRDLSKDIQLEVLTAIIEYGLYGRLPENLKPFAKSMFTLIKPNIDVNASRFENGKRGGRPKKQPVSPEPAYTQTYEQEVEHMRADADWRKTVCQDFQITEEEYEKRLSRFLDRCTDDKTRKGKQHHDSLEDCRSHLRYWMSKAYPHQSASTTGDDTVPFPEPAPAPRKQTAAPPVPDNGAELVRKEYEARVPGKEISWAQYTLMGFSRKSDAQLRADIKAIRDKKLHLPTAPMDMIDWGNNSHPDKNWTAPPRIE